MDAGDTEPEIIGPDEVSDRPDEDYNVEDEGNEDEVKGADAENQDSNENGTVDGDNQPSNATDNKNDLTENRIEPYGEGDNASSAAKETQKEQTSDNNNNQAAANNANTTAPPPPQPQGQQQPQPKKQPQTQPETKTLANSIPSLQEKAPCPSSYVPLPTPEDDAATLHRAFKGKGCDVGKVVQILAQRDSTHRNQIALYYKRNYDEELSDRISSEFSRIGLGDLKEQVGVDLTINPTGSFSLFCNDIKRAIALWLLNESERDATIVWLSLQMASFDKAAVTEVICSRTPSQLRKP
ncbi:Annexin D5 [Cinnamomum micranthum f. kanehirae]|uniref:Annexin D5 n=1 Tax=Cinnamomum micranthum f. kanehirae TaxID=337451 RepID=A0A3S3M8G7_9MAGN|nr:Annexin D5 [Cinnamomum micranthum f. kanehirae]